MEPLFDSQVFQDIITFAGAIIRLLGMAGIGVAAGWFALEVLRKGQQAWQLQIAVFLGVVTLILGMTKLLSSSVSANLNDILNASISGNGGAAGALGMFGLGLCAALLIWGLPKKQKKEEKEDK
jgi:hypothetical protein